MLALDVLHVQNSMLPFFVESGSQACSIRINLSRSQRLTKEKVFCAVMIMDDLSSLCSVADMLRDLTNLQTLSLFDLDELGFEDNAQLFRSLDLHAALKEVYVGTRLCEYRDLKSALATKVVKGFWVTEELTDMTVGSSSSYWRMYGRLSMFSAPGVGGGREGGCLI